MTTATIQSVNFLPITLQTDRNAKFLASTLDQMIQPAQLDRIDGYIGSKLTPTYNSTSDVYISENTVLRRNYQLDPALVTNDALGNIQDVQGYDDLINELNVKGANTDNLDRLFRSEIYSYNPHIDWDKLVNYQHYYWMGTDTTEVIEIITPGLNVEQDILGQTSFTFTATVTGENVSLSNGMIVTFSNPEIGNKYLHNEYYVEGVGTGIVLVNLADLVISANTYTEYVSYASVYVDRFDSNSFGNYGFDSNTRLPIDPEYITINRASPDLNPWSRYNRWVHQDVIIASASANGITPVLPADKRAQRPIIEFNAGIQLYNFGSVGIQPIDLIDTSSVFPFNDIDGVLVNPKSGLSQVYIDGVMLEPGQRIIFNAAEDPLAVGKIYEVVFVPIKGKLTVTLQPTYDNVPNISDVVTVTNGSTYAGSSWWYNGTNWSFAQQKTSLNQAPLFDLFDENGNSYSDTEYYVDNFAGNQIFGYRVGTGTADPYLGFPLSYRNINAVGSFLFANYFSNSSINVVVNSLESYAIPTSITYFKVGNKFYNIWDRVPDYHLPILQITSPASSTSTIQLTSVVNPLADKNLITDVYLNNSQVKLTGDKYSITTSSVGGYFINFNNTLTNSDSVLIETYTSQTPTDTGYYLESLSLTNNPLNGSISSFTLSELTEHVNTMINRLSNYRTSELGGTNLRDLGNYNHLGTQLISNANPLAFAHMFIGKKEHSVIDAITKVSDQYSQFKFGLINQLTKSSNQTNPALALDQALTIMNSSQGPLSPYYRSDMLAYGNDAKVRTWTVKDTEVTSYPLFTEFGLGSLSTRSILVYVNDNQLVHGRDYTFDTIDPLVNISISLNIGDIVVLKDYPDTRGSFIPPTPSKLGLYPKYIPSIFIDNTYVTPTKVIQGHDGSITVAYNDYRDAALLEFEKRIYNNIKVGYNSDLLDINTVIPGAFRSTDYSISEINAIVTEDFTRWAGKYNIDYTENREFFNSSNPKTWNYSKSYSALLGIPMYGSWRSLFKYFYDTDRPHTAPWEMLGFSEMPDWWENRYGPAPYTSGNKILWDDLEQGYIAHGPTQGIHTAYSRPGLSQIIPVDDYGYLLDPIDNLVTAGAPPDIRQNWIAGDQGPQETAWRRSSYWPFAVQKLLALTKPLIYASYMYNPSQMFKNYAGQWTYGAEYDFLNINSIPVFDLNETLTNGYSVMVAEVGRQRSTNYLNELQQDLSYANYNLFFKVGGFVDQSTLQIIIDAYEPTTADAGALLPSQNYTIRLNSSNPILSIGVSGIIIEKNNGNFVLRGYDTQDPYFTYYAPLRNSSSRSITVGGVTEPYVVWSPSGTQGANGLSSGEVTTAKAGNSTNFYPVGQIVQYGSNYYRVTVAHQAEQVFNSALYQMLSSLPVKGGATVQIATNFNPTPMQVLYGTEFSSIQEVYDVIVGYGRWLTTQGFVFDEHNTELGTVLDWNFSASEFLFWSTQNWGDSSVLTVSPFANQIKFQATQAVVDNLFDSFYQYSILKADGNPYPQKNLSVSRLNGLCTIATLPNTDGIYFARLNCIQKEHSIVFDNIDDFGDVIFNVETGSRQHRMKVVGFRTANWNGDLFSPGFIYDQAITSIWSPYVSYRPGDVVYYSGNYYSAIDAVNATPAFNATKWNTLAKKPTPKLLPNFNYKINQFQDFYSLDIDNFDAGQQKMAQHLTGYTPRVYLNNVFTDPIAQYKFYQGFIKEKGTENAIAKLGKASLHNLQGNITYNEEWAFRVGHYGSYSTYREIEIPLVEGTFLENPQIINLVKSVPSANLTNSITYITPSELAITPVGYVSSQTFITTSTTDVIKMLHAGYVRTDDVTATAYNENSLLDIANNNKLNDGDTVWLGFRQDGNWDVLRYTKSSAEVIGVYVSRPASQITFTTDRAHNLSAGKIVSVVNFNSQVDGVYIVQSIPQYNQFAVSSTLASITNAPLLAPGQLFEFVTARYSSFDNLPGDSELYKNANGTLYWIDGAEDGSSPWAVYEKVDNYTSKSYLASTTPIGQGHGYSLSLSPDNTVLVSGSPNFAPSGGAGRVFVYNVINGVLSLVTQYDPDFVNGSALGYTVVYDSIPYSTSTYGLIFAGAPGSSSNQGAVKISSINQYLEEESRLVIHGPVANSRFGSSIFVEKNAVSKTVLVGAPGSSTAGAVYNYTISSAAITTGSYTLLSPAGISLSTGDQWGYAISGTDSGNFVAISAPSHNTGIVSIFDSYVQSQLITSPFENGKAFGTAVHMSSSGDYLFISDPYAYTSINAQGQVAVYKNTNGVFTLTQIITNPNANGTTNFGIAIDINSSIDNLIISSKGSFEIDTGFDHGKDIFDQGSTIFYDEVIDSGTVYLYVRQDSRFVYAQEISTSTINTVSGSNFGNSIAISSDDTIYVGAPATSAPSAINGIIQFDIVDSAVNGLKQLRVQPDLTVIDTVRKITLIDTFNEDVLDYLEFIDPIKGKISGIAEQELTYKLISDPAIYSIGTAGVNVDTNKNWLDLHVGELWWDLSTAKFTWYEQGELEYRKNNWGKLFPGATIDVYEWVGSTLLPSDWSSQADTPTGLTKGISGQPKFADNSAISVKQIYDPITSTFSNVYYYWVKNKITVPNISSRRASSYQVASIIADPTAYGLQYAAFISSDAVALSNVGSLLVDNRINVNISQDSINNSIPLHTSWLLLQEGAESSMPGALLEQKLFDSLLGHDRLGNLVPDPTLTARTRYGIEIRPRQSIFVNRIQALRNVVEFANSVLTATIITSNYNISNLEAQENYPDPSLNLYDQLVEDNYAFDRINTDVFSAAEIQFVVNGNGNVTAAYIVQSGSGYGTLNPAYDNAGNQVGYQGPAFTGLDNPVENIHGTGLQVSTVVNALGQIISISIIDQGTGYTDNFIASPRPHTVIVLNDSTYNGKWSEFVFNGSWLRQHTQQYNTTLYWNYVDWISSDFKPYKDYKYTVGNTYNLVTLDLSVGDYVKVLNGGNGNYIILEFVDAAITQGTFSDNFNLLYSQNGTIQLSDTLWNASYGFNNNDTYDQTLYDQTPDIEIQYILTALRDDIFINDLRVNWNLLFFTAVKYALSEQKLLDWAFKTSFIKVTNNAVNLGQPPVYKLQDDTYFQQYVEEVKPYHTQIRTFVTKYPLIDNTNSQFDDFDFPSHYDSNNAKFVAEIVSTSTVAFNPVREMNIEIKFDRVSTVNQIGSTSTVDTFICDGFSKSYTLNWAAHPNKSTIKILLGGILVQTADYTLTTYTKLVNGYNKQFTDLVFLNTTPSQGVKLTVYYNKSYDLYNATDRIYNLYAPTEGMPGVDPNQLMVGVSFPGTIVGGQYEGIGFRNSYGGFEPDSYINGGTWTDGTIVDALGVDPTDFTLDGEYGFVTPNSSYAPEELVPGFITDTLGINVYTRSTSTVLGYRMFRDILGNTTFTRISQPASTYLTRSLQVTDTEIHIASINGFTPPDIVSGIPGVVLINDERIEYFSSTASNGVHILSHLRRATYGTGINSSLSTGTTVFDQGANQLISYTDVTLIQNTFTNTLTNQYRISTATSLTNTYPTSTATIRFDGITLPTTYTGDQRLEDILQVYYAGRLLRKNGSYITDTTSTYDSLPLSSIVGSLKDLTTLGQVSSEISNAYLVTSTNQVWVYTGVGFESALAPGYVYAGVKYIPPDFTINTVTTSVVLNTATVDLQSNIRLTFVKTMTSATNAWNDADGGQPVSMTDSSSTIPTFLQAGRAVLPNNRYYGQL